MSDPAERPAPSLGKLGVEIELMAPAGKSREDLARAIARKLGGKVRRFFHPQGEPSKVPNKPIFENLTLGFVIEDHGGELLAQCVDDLTLQDDLVQATPPKAGWYRIVSDDARFLRLAMLHADPEGPLDTVLDPLAALFGTEAERNDEEMVRVADRTGSPIAIGTTLPGERERPCEIVTRPLTENHHAELETLLEPARAMGCAIPAEGALHLHFDAGPLCTASTIANLVRFLGVHSENLKDHFQTNPRCRRLGQWPTELLDIVSSEGFAQLGWEEARERLLPLSLTKYSDFNLYNLVHQSPGKHTFEVRILPVSLDASPIIDAAMVFTRILEWAKTAPGTLHPIPEGLDSFL